MRLTANQRRRLIESSLPRCRVERTRDGFWRVRFSGRVIAVFDTWEDAVTFARWKATR